jgi:hypothetical protein
LVIPSTIIPLELDNWIPPIVQLPETAALPIIGKQMAKVTADHQSGMLVLATADFIRGCPKFHIID